MPSERGCTVCASPNRDLIEKALAGGSTYATVARTYGVHKSSIQRHQVGHKTPALIAISQAAGVAGTKRRDHRPAIDQLVEKLGETQAIHDLPLSTATSRLVALKQSALLIEQIARLRGEFNPPPPVVVSFETSQDWVDIQRGLMVALAPHPEARAAVVAMLGDLQK